MGSLEAKVPPVVWFAAAGLLVWVLAAAEVDSVFDGDAFDVIGLVVIAVGVGVAGAGVVRFGAARTTVNPHSIDSASSLVTGGVYRVTRNPMYLGLLMALCGWGLLRGSVVALLVGATSFVVVMNHLQIGPEERALSRKFGSDYDAYTQRVRRWI